MDKTGISHKWKRMANSKHYTRCPSSRWGHVCCVIRDEFVVFGGYADNSYMNDIWSFNATTSEWREVMTTGQLPENRSNCTMNYDPVNNRIIIFGGGGPNKLRFNDVCILDWTTKNWTTIVPTRNPKITAGESAPWQRTYHSAQLLYPYLVVFGGEGIIDLDDLWVFNIQTLKWVQLQCNKSQVKPPARRFHASALLGREMYILAGCHNRYRSLNDVYSIDLTALVHENQFQGLDWREHKLQGSALLTRWGHSASVLEDRIYVFGGRFSNDLNDLLTIDIKSSSIKPLRGTQDSVPAARRRHCAAFLGCSLIIFAGFNGVYLNDMHYTSLHGLRLTIPKLQIVQRYHSLVDSEQGNPMLNCRIQLCSGTQIKVNPTLWLPVLGHSIQKLRVVCCVLQRLEEKEAIHLIKYLYSGVGEVDKAILKKLQLPDFRTQFPQVKAYCLSLCERTGSSPSKTATCSSGVLKFPEGVWENIMCNHVHSEYFDVIIKSGSECVKSNRAVLSVMSTYFSILFDEEFKDDVQRVVVLDHLLPRVLKILIKFIEFDIVLIPQTFTEVEWVELAAASKMYCLPRLSAICEAQLILVTSLCNLQYLFEFSVTNGLSTLATFCSEQQVRNQVKFYSQDHSLDYQLYSKLRVPETYLARKMMLLKESRFRALYLQLQQARLERVILNRGLKRYAQEICYQRENTQAHA